MYFCIRASVKKDRLSSNTNNDGLTPSRYDGQPTKVYSLISIIVMFVQLKMSDDERLSLTTAISDEDEHESQRASPYRSKAASFNCTGAVRKAGFLSVKKWLLRRRHQVSLLCSWLTSCFPLSVSRNASIRHRRHIFCHILGMCS